VVVGPITATADIVTGGTISASSAQLAGNVEVAGLGGIVASGVETAGFFVGNGSQMTDLPAADGFLGYDVIMLAGQSNMVGFPAEPVLPPATSFGFPDNKVADYSSPNIHAWNRRTGMVGMAEDVLPHPDTGTGSSIGMSFARLWEHALAPGRKLLLVPNAQGGSGFFFGENFRNWDVNKPGNCLDLAIQNTNRAMAYHPLTNPRPVYYTAGGTVAAGPPNVCPMNRLVGFLWHQGENNVGASEEEYKAALQRTVDAFRSINGATSKTPFIVGTMVPGTTSPAITVLKNVGDFAYFGREYCGCVYTEVPFWIDVSPTDNPFGHFTNKGYRELGSRYYDEYMRVSRGGPAALQAVSMALANNDDVNVSWTTSAADVDSVSIDVYQKGIITWGIYSYNAATPSHTQFVGTFISKSSPYVVPSSLLTLGLAYEARVRPRGVSGAAGPAVTVTISNTGTTPPLPTLTGLAVQSVGQATRISWTPNSNVTLVKLYAATPATSTTFIKIGETTSASFDTVELNFGTQYKIRAVPFNRTFQGTVGDTGATATDKTYTTPTAPVAITNFNGKLDINADGVSGVVLSWTKDGLTTNVKLSYKKGESADVEPHIDIAESSGTSYSCPIYDLPSALPLELFTKYTFRAIPYDANGNRGTALRVAFDVRPLTFPPEKLVVSAAPKGGGFKYTYDAVAASATLMNTAYGNGTYRVTVPTPTTTNYAYPFSADGYNQPEGETKYDDIMLWPAPAAAEAKGYFINNNVDPRVFTPFFQIQLPLEIKLRSYSMRSMSQGNGGRAPSSWTLSASNNGTDWTNIDQQSGLSWNPGFRGSWLSELKTFTMPAGTPKYRYYKLTWNVGNNSFGGFAQLIFFT
jgi:hypothetical protein